MGLSGTFRDLFGLVRRPSSTAGQTPFQTADAPFADYFIRASSDIVGLNNGLWGIMRS